MEKRPCLPPHPARRDGRVVASLTAAGGGLPIALSPQEPRSQRYHPVQCEEGLSEPQAQARGQASAQGHAKTQGQAQGRATSPGQREGKSQPAYQAKPRIGESGAKTNCGNRTSEQIRTRAPVAQALSLPRRHSCRRRPTNEKHGSHQKTARTIQAEARKQRKSTTKTKPQIIDSYGAYGNTIGASESRKPPQHEISAIFCKMTP